MEKEDKNMAHCADNEPYYFYYDYYNQKLKRWCKLKNFLIKP